MRFIPELLATCLAIGCGSTSSGPSADQNPYQQQQPYPQYSQATPQQPEYTQPEAQQPAQPQQGTQQPARSGEDAVVESFEYASGGSHLGVVVEGMTRDLRNYFGAPKDRGVLVAHVERHSAAARAGLMVGDVLVAVGDQPIRSADDVISALAARNAGAVHLDLIRQGRPMRVDATLPTEQNPQGSHQML